MLFNRKTLTRLVVPILLEQALAQTVGLADTLMVAQAGESAVSAVSLVDAVNILILYFIGAMSAGGAIVISHAIGSKKDGLAREASKQMLWVSVLFSGFIALVLGIFHKGILRLIYGSIGTELMELAQIYFLITALSFPFVAIRNAVGAAYRSYGNSKMSLNVSLITNALNVGGNAILIFGFDMGVVGAAASTFVSRAIGAVIVLILAARPQSIAHIPEMWKFKPNGKIIRRILGLGLPNGFEGSVFQLGKVLTQSLISTMGPIAIAANATANTLTSMLYIPGTGMSGAITTVVGQCVGANENKQAKKYAFRLVAVVYGIIAAMTLIMTLFLPQLVGAFNLSAESTALAKKLFIFHAIFVTTVWPTAFTLPSAFRAAGDITYTMVLSIISMWVFRVGGSVLFAKVFDCGVMSVWYGLACDWVFRALFFGIRFFRETWLKQYKTL